MIPTKTTTGEMMKKLIVPLLFLALFNPFAASAAMQVLGTKANTAPGHLDADANFSKQNANNAELQANKADKDKVVRYWADHPDGTTLASGTLVAYGGKLYNTTQNFLKTAGATPDTFTEYFEQASGGGVTSYNDLTDKPTLGAAASLNAGTSPNNLLQLDGSGKVPAVDGSQLTGISGTLPDCPSTNQTWEWDATTSSAKCVDWQTISADGTTISISGGVLSETGASASGLLTVKGRNAAGVFGYLPVSDFFSAGATYTIVAEAPTSASANGLKLNTANGHLYAKTDDGIFEYTGAFSAWDTVPAAFTFTDETDVALNTLKIGNEITVADINYPSPITVTGSSGAAYQKNSGPCTSASDTVVAGDKVKPCNQTSILNSTSTATTISIGGITDTYTCTTLAGTSCTGDYGYNTGTTLTATSNLSMWVRRVPACTSGTIKSISARIDSYNTTGRRLMAVVYADNAGEPGTKLYASAPVWNSGWGSATLRTLVSGLNVATSGAYVWEGIVSEVGSISSWTRDTSVTGDMRYTTIATMETASVPAEWPTATDGTSTYSMYIYDTY